MVFAVGYIDDLLFRVDAHLAGIVELCLGQWAVQVSRRVFTAGPDLDGACREVVLVDTMVPLVGEIDDVGVARVENQPHDVALGVYEPVRGREVFTFARGGIPAGYYALVGIEIEFVVGGTHRECLDGVPHGGEITVGVEQVAIPLDVPRVGVGIVGDGVEIAVTLVADVGVVPVDVAGDQVGAQENAGDQDAEIVEYFDIPGLLAHHVDAVLAAVVYAEAHKEVVVFVDGDPRFGFRREVRPDQRSGAFGHGSTFRTAGNRGNIRLDNVVEQFVEPDFVLFVLADGDGDDTLFAREFGREDEHTVACG